MRIPKTSLHFFAVAGANVARRRREALVHAAMPWIPTDRQRRMLLLRFKPQHRGTACFPPEIMRRLAPETRAVAELWGEGEVRAVATQPGSARL